MSVRILSRFNIQLQGEDIKKIEESACDKRE